ncbi:hypothetical protein [Priestia megaterium]|uniref:hypothetical protein n=1 Tax=Priestia megaterium TaxID=1404 RepID=UPI000BF58D6A|nr:hypothetical protein [Priestia megaterium]PFW44749.1 hypothetical protein COL17_25190 [Priestia megaterium]
MKKNIQIFSILTILITGLIGCSAMQTDKEVYKGEKLNIAVVGEIPEINEKESNINFKKLSLKDIKKIDLKSYDAVIITKPYLSKAANKKYKDTYLNGQIPFFFVESKGSILPFVDNSLTYKQYADRVNDTQSYIVGVLGNPNGDNYNTWQYDYAIKNDKFDRTDVKGIYSRVFKTVEKVKKEKRS